LYILFLLIKIAKLLYLSMTERAKGDKG